jgi:Co/Zn/Cd efflux system component
MKFIAILMVLAGLLIGLGAADELRYFGPETTQFWVGVFATPAGFFFTVAGILLWRRGSRARQLVMIAALVMASATLAATALHVMGPPATLVGVVSSLVALGWTWKSRTVVVQ